MENENVNTNTKTVYYNAFVKEKPKIPLREAVLAWVAYALSFVFTHFCMPYFGGIWGGIFWAAFGIFIVVYAKSNSVKLEKIHVILLGISEIFCLTPIFSANKFVCFLAAVFSFALYFYLMTAVTGADVFGRHFILDFCRSILIRPFESFIQQPISAFSVFKGKKRTKNILYALAGLAISIPLTVVVVLLLISSDKTFGNIITSIFDIAWFSISWVWQLLFAVPVAMFLFGAAHSMTKPAPVNRDDTAGSPEYRFIPSVIAYFTVSPICVFYLIYVIVQVGNIANALGKNIGYADFARQGFFQLCAISVINLIVIVALQTFCKRNENDVKPVVLRVYSIMISVFTLFIIATALTKMFMYINEYGMTMLRVYTSWFMILLGVIFIPIIILQIKDFPIWKAIFAAFTVMFAVLCFGNFEGNIAAYNINAYRNGAIEKLDVDQFEELGIAAVPSAYKLYNECTDDDPELRVELWNFIVKELVADSDLSRSAYFSVPRAEAWNAFTELREHESAIENEKEVMRIVINVDCATAYGVELEYSLDGKPTSGKGSQLASGTRIRQGDQLVFTFTEQDIPDEKELSKIFGAQFRVIYKNGDLIIPDIPENWANTSESYDGTHYTLSEGEFEDGTLAEPVWEWNAERGGVYEFRLTAGRGNGKFYLFPMH